MNEELETYLKVISYQLDEIDLCRETLVDTVAKIRLLKEPIKKVMGNTNKFKDSVTRPEYLFMEESWNYWYSSKLKYFQENVPCTTQRQFAKYMNIALGRQHVVSTYITFLNRKQLPTDFKHAEFTPVLITIEDIKNVSETSN